MISRNSRPEEFCKKGVLRNFTKFTGKHLCQSLFFNKVAGLSPAALLKKRLWQRCFPVNFVKFLRTPFHTEHLSWLLLDINEIFDIFYKTLSEIVDCHATLTKVTKKERTLQSKPWINKEIKHLMWKRDKLFRKYCACKNETQKKKLIHEEFEKLRNNVTFSICKSKNEYFKLFLDKNRNNITLIWKGSRQLITRKSKSKVRPNIEKGKR